MTKSPDPTRIRDISEAVYRARLGSVDAAKMESKRPGSVRINAACMDTLTRVYLDVLGGELAKVEAAELMGMG